MSIKLKTLKASDNTVNTIQQNYLYKDISFDLTNDVFKNNQLNKTENLKDILPLYDVEAVKNSIKTAFLTSPGQKILNPTYGIDLRQYLFEPVDDFTSEIIQDTISVKLPRIEPRITLEDVSVVANEDEQMYEIYITINIPSLDISGLSIKSELNSTGYQIV